MMRLGYYALLTIMVASLVTTLPGEVPCCELNYEVRPDPTAGVVDISLTIYGFDGDSLVLVRPSARPLVGLLAQDPEVKGARAGRWDVVDGAPRWTYAQPKRGWSDPIRIQYRLAITAEKPVNAWSVGLGPELLYAPAEALFLTPEMPSQAAMHARVRVHWRLPRDWEVVAGWNEYAFHGVRSLLRTNVLAGSIEHHQREACGMTVEFAAQGEWTFDRGQLADDLAALSCATRHRLGDPGIDRLSVTLVPARFPMTSGNRNGPHAIGLVHRLPDGARPSTRLLAHELVHLWQQYDAPLWFQEGVNDYLALRIAHEAELLDTEDYLDHLAAIDATYRANPHRREWSFDDERRELPPFGPSDEYLAYRKGAIVGLALDRELRLRTEGEIDVAVLWREMNDLAAWGHVRWTADEIADRTAALVNGNVSPFFGRFVHGTADLPRPKTLLVDLPPLPEPRAERGGLARVAAFIQATLD